MNNETDSTALISAEAVMSYMGGIPKEVSQFDFLQGRWDTQCARYSPDGTKILTYKGIWLGEKLKEGRIFLDQFTAFLEDGTEISHMATLRTYSIENKRWEMTFLVSHQAQLVTEFTGTLQNGEMCLKGVGSTLSGKPMVFRVRFYQITELSFEWENEVSLDNGKSWWRDSTISATKITT